MSRLESNLKLNSAFTKALTLLQNSTSVFLTTHERTDGDDLGTVLSLAHALKAKGKSVTVGIKGGVPDQLKFMPGNEWVVGGWPRGLRADCVVVSGCSTLDRTGLPELEAYQGTIINFDHHPDNTLYGTINAVDPTASAVAIIAYEFFVHARWKITSEIATCILTGLVTDTGSFLHSNTDISTLKAASNLMRRGARTTLVTKHTYHTPDTRRLKAWSHALSTAWLDREKGMVCSAITTEDLIELGDPPLAVFEGVVETMNKVPEAQFAMLLKQDGPVVKGSLRSDPHKEEGGIDVGKLARLLGGGGHRYAAGFSIRGRLRRLAGNSWAIEA